MSSTTPTGAICHAGNSSSAQRGGPLANLILAAALWHVAPLLASGSLELGLFNILLPVHGSDGRWMLRSLRGHGAFDLA